MNDFSELYESCKVKFETLPEPLQRRYYHDPTVNMWVSAFTYGRITREAMFEGLAAALVEKTAMLDSALSEYLKWFGAPPFKVTIPK